MSKRKRNYLISFMWQQTDHNSISYVNNNVTITGVLDEKAIEDIRESLAKKTQEIEKLSEQPIVCILNIIPLGR